MAAATDHVMLFPVTGRDRDHYHCPLGCEHPQPFLEGEILFCGRCWFVVGRPTVMVLCDEAICPPVEEFSGLFEGGAEKLRPLPATQQGNAVEARRAMLPARTGKATRTFLPSAPSPPLRVAGSENQDRLARRPVYKRIGLYQIFGLAPLRAAPVSLKWINSNRGYKDKWSALRR